MVRTIITPTNTDIHLSIPKDYVGKQIEITCITLEELNPKASKKTMADFWGVISDETANSLNKLTEQGRGEWDI